MPEWLVELRPFTPLHGLTVLVFGGAMALVIGVGRKWRGTARERRLRRGLVAFILAWQTVSVVWWLLPGKFHAATSLPLHLCDLVAWVGALALATESRVARTITYFWGFGLSSQGFVTPVNSAGPGDFDYWVFWINHAQIVGAALYVVIVLGYRPKFRDAAIAYAATALYAAVMIPLNERTGWNYGYVGSAQEETETLVTALGAWPLRLLPLAGIVALWFLVLWGMWPLVERLQRAAPR